MKFSTTSTFCTLASLAVNGVNACWQVHVFMNNDLFLGDTVTVQALDNNVEKCVESKTIYLASSDDVFEIDCGDGLIFSITDNGRSGHVSDPNHNYEGDLTLNDYQTSSIDCYCTDSHCGKCLQIEACLDDDYYNCNDYPYCSFCDYKSYC